MMWLGYLLIGAFSLIPVGIWLAITKPKVVAGGNCPRCCYPGTGDPLRPCPECGFPDNEPVHSHGQLAFRYALMLAVAIGPTVCFELFRALVVRWGDAIYKGIHATGFPLLTLLLGFILLTQPQIWTLLWLFPRAALQVRILPFLVLALFASALGARVFMLCFLELVFRS